MKESLHQQNKSIKKAKSLKSPLLDPYRSRLLLDKKNTGFNNSRPQSIRGQTTKDAQKIVEDLHKIFKDDSKFLKFRQLISIGEDGKTLNKIDLESLAEALEGIELNRDDQALIDIVVNTINQDKEHVVEFVRKNEYVSNTGKQHLLKKLPTLASVIEEDFAGKCPAGAIINHWGGAGNILTDTGSYSIIVEDYQGGGDSDYFFETINQYIGDPLGRPGKLGHEVFGHGYPKTGGRVSKEQKHVDAIKTENLILRVAGKGYIQRDGTDHGTGNKIENYQELPDFR